MVETTKTGNGATIVGIITPANRHDPEAWRALSLCSRVEFRADLWDPSLILAGVRSFREECLRKFGQKMEIIFTLRLNSDGGAWANTLALEREKIWLSLGINQANPPCDWLDIEIENFSSLSPEMVHALHSRRLKLLASHHKMDGMPSLIELENLVKLHSSTHAESFKIAVSCTQRSEVLDLMNFAKSKVSAIAGSCVLSMGPMGQATRLISPLLGCPLTYGYLTGDAVAPGQLSVTELNAFFSNPNINQTLNLTQAELLAWTEARLQEGLLENE